MKFLLIIAFSFAFGCYMNTLTKWLDDLDK